jgi:hypothetical protein
MAAPRDRRHLFIQKVPAAENYQPHPRDFSSLVRPPPDDRPGRGRSLKQSFELAVAQAAARRQQAGVAVEGADPGIYVQFDSEPDTPLDIQALEDRRQKIEVVAVRAFTIEGDIPKRIERATVFVPEGKVQTFLKRFDAYSKTQERAPRERRYENMLDPVATLRLATLRALWTDDQSIYPNESDKIWWELWLRRHDGKEVLRVERFAKQKDVILNTRRLEFDDRIVILAYCTSTQLATSIDLLNDLAEVRKAKDAATFFIELSATEQAEWLADLQKRITPATDGAPAVCILDTGVSNAHPLLSPSLKSKDCHACDSNWGTHDHDGHGTLMAGLALFGDLTPHLAGSSPVSLRHTLESVKILPPPPQTNAPELYGSVTAAATSLAEISAPDRPRSFAMAVTATDRHDRGEPTSWSAAIDALAAGRSFDIDSQSLTFIDDPSDVRQRLFLISAGNVDGNVLEPDHLTRSDLEMIQDPAQAWNALTIGAYTNKSVIQSPKYNGWSPVAIADELSPYSSTGVSLASQWPSKPDVVFEGGNAIKDSSGQVDFPCEDLSLLSTYYKPHQKSFGLSWATSAATALAAEMAGKISAEYSTFWPETVRGLIVHSAEWTKPMLHQFANAANKTARARLLRRYGYGVPNLSRALRSASDSLTLIAQGVIHPFSEGTMHEMHLHALPWPIDTLSLLDTDVRMRVTLSYFIEPNPARVGWRRRHRYSSHNLRFEVRAATESTEEFRKRINHLALDKDKEEERPPNTADSSEWFLGPVARNRGSLHSDILEVSAADLAARGMIAVYPVSGWWKDQPTRDRSEIGARYSLIVSIDTPDIDIWTEVTNQLGIEIETEH